jgi:hypothetical protein
VPLRAQWNKTPPEGERFVSGEIDWTSGGAPNRAVQVSLGGNSPVAISQIIAIAVDNSRCGADVQFIFSDSGFVLNIPTHIQGVYPVFTNALNFYIVSSGSNSGDITAWTVLNSMPPPLSIQPTATQQNIVSPSIPLTANSSTQVIPTTVSGTLTAIDINPVLTAGASAGSVTISLVGGGGQTHWSRTYSVPANSTISPSTTLTGLATHFWNGMTLVVSGSTGITAGNVYANLYYTVP